MDSQTASKMDIEHRHQPPESVLLIQAGIRQIAFFPIPFGQASIIVHLLGIYDNEWDEPETQALLQCDKSPDPSIAVLKRMNALEFAMKTNDIVD